MHFAKHLGQLLDLFFRLPSYKLKVSLPRIYLLAFFLVDLSCRPSLFQGDGHALEACLKFKRIQEEKSQDAGQSLS